MIYSTRLVRNRTSRVDKTRSTRWTGRRGGRRGSAALMRTSRRHLHFHFRGSCTRSDHMLARNLSCYGDYFSSGPRQPRLVGRDKICTREIHDRERRTRGSPEQRSSNGNLSFDRRIESFARTIVFFECFRRGWRRVCGSTDSIIEFFLITVPVVFIVYRIDFICCLLGCE